MNNALKWGAIMGVALVALNLILYVAGFSDVENQNTTVSILSTITTIALFIGTIVMGLSAYKRANSGLMSFGQGLGQSILIALIGGIIVSIWTYIFMTVIDPSLMEDAKEAALAGAGDVPEEQEEMVNSMIGAITSPIVLSLFQVFFYAFGGLIVGLVASAVMKKDAPFGTNTL